MGWSPIRQVKKAASNVAKAVVGGVEVVADDFLGIDDSGGIVGSVSKIGEKVEDGLREAVDEVDKAIQNPYVQLAIAIATGGAATPYLSAYATLDSGENLSPAQIAALAASAGQDFGAFDAASIDPEVVNEIKKGVQVATADNPGEAFLMAYGTEVAQETGLTEAFDNQVASTFGQNTLDVLKTNEDYILDSARFASGNMSEEELVAKYGAGAVNYATQGTALEDYNKELSNSINVAMGNMTAEEFLVDTYGENIVNKLGADSENERAVGLGALTVASNKLMGADDQSAYLAGLKKANDEGFAVSYGDIGEVAGIDVKNLIETPDFLKNLGNTFGSPVDLAFVEDAVREYSPYIEDAGRYIASNLPNVDVPVTFGDLQGLDVNFDNLVANAKDYIPSVDFSGFKTGDLGDYSVKQLQDLGVDLPSLNLQSEFQMIGLANLLDGDYSGLGDSTQPGEELAMLEPNLDFLQDDDTPFSRQLLETGKIA